VRTRGGPATVTGKSTVPARGHHLEPAEERAVTGPVREGWTIGIDPGARTLVLRRHPPGTRYPQEVQHMSTAISSLDVGQRHRASLWMLVLASALFLVTFEQGALTGGQPLLHELFHDARHLLGFPCH
jgi:hypothetical protein